MHTETPKIFTETYTTRKLLAKMNETRSEGVYGVAEVKGRWGDYTQSNIRRTVSLWDSLID